MIGEGLVGLVERRVLRRGWSTTALLVFVLTLSAGATMTAVAGGRRAATSYDRFLAWSDQPEASVGGGGADSSAEAEEIFALVAALPQVEWSIRSVLVGDEVAIGGHVLPFLTLLPGAFDLDDPPVDHVKVVKGRSASPDAVGEAILGFETADRLDLDVGDEVQIRFRPPEDDPAAQWVEETVTIVGIEAAPGSFPTMTGQPFPVLLLTPAFLRAHQDRVDWTNGSVDLKLRDHSPEAVEAFKAAVDEASIPYDHISSIYDDAPGVRKLVRVEAGVMWLMAAIIAGAAVVIVMQLFRREAAGAGADLRVLRFLGLPRSTVAAGGALHGARVGLLAAVGAVAVALATSPLLPRGVARIADPDTGFHADFVVLGLGAAVTILLAVGVGAGVAVLAARAARVRVPRTAALGSITTRLPPAPAAGVRLALGPTASGPAAALRIGLFGLGTVVAALVGLVSMLASFDRILERPELSGSTWDMSAHYDESDGAAAAAPLIAADPAVENFTRGGWRPIQVNGRRVYSVFLEPSTTVNVAIESGRPPIGPDEIALGPAELAALGVSIGDTVEVAVPEIDGTTYPETVSATVTGRAIVAAPWYEQLGPGEGGVVTASLMSRIVGDTLPSNTFFITLHEDGSVRDTAAALAERISPNFWFGRADRSGVRSLRNMRQLPYVLVGLLAVIALAALVHRLVSSARTERRQLAVLRSLGFTDRQLVRAGGIQGGTVAVLTLIVAVPVGLLAAVIAWRRIAAFLAVVPQPVIPLPAVLVVAGAALVVGVVAGWVVARHARRRSAGTLLRTE